MQGALFFQEVFIPRLQQDIKEQIVSDLFGRLCHTFE
jgi:hypothetical protein